ncbi:MAG: hypothetical protein JWO30_516 [Fibrobacteres bacterium]|nr:hypothetical protein [Fibrobacterota bacterium]
MKKVVAIFCALGLHQGWSASGLFAKMPEAPKAYVFDSRPDGTDARIAALCLAGMINQTSAEAYVISRDHDLEQLIISKKPYEMVTPVPGDSLTGLLTLFVKYSSRVQKMILYDPKKDWSFYLAMMAAAQQGGVPVTPALRDSLKKSVPAWNGTVDDYRDRWTGRIPAYDYALQNLMPGCTNKSVFVIKYDRGIPLFDYASAAKGFVFWLDFNPGPDSLEVEKILSSGKYAVGASLMGYANVEDHANKVANKFGIGYVASDYYANGSFWASFPNKTFTQPTRPAIIAEKGKVYVCFLWSDGDNVQFDQNGIYSVWKDPARGSIPVGTALNPGLQELNPVLLDYYYANKTPNDELISGPCGFQFIYTVFFNAGMYPAWLDLNKKWLADAGFHAGSIWWTTYPTPAYDAYTKSCGLEGLFHNYGQPFTKPLFQNGVALFNEYIKERRNADSVYLDLAGVAANPAAPEFRAEKVITPDFGPTGYAKLKAVADSLNRKFPNKYVFLLPTAFINTAKVWYGQPVALGGAPLRPEGVRSAVAEAGIRLPRSYFESKDGLRDAAGRKPMISRKAGGDGLANHGPRQETPAAR